MHSDHIHLSFPESIGFYGVVDGAERRRRDCEEHEICGRCEKERKKKRIETKRKHTYAVIMFGNQPADLHG